MQGAEDSVERKLGQVAARFVLELIVKVNNHADHFLWENI
jgi:hypothetical protein